MNVGYTCLILWLLASLRVFGQQDGVFRTERLGTKDGLSNRWTMCVHQDAKGYLWVGTYDGLNRYDGNDFNVYRPSAQGKFPVSADLIVQIAETTEGKILLSTGYGILRFDPETGVFDQLVKKDGSHTALILNSGRGAPLLEAGTELWGNAGISLTVYEALPSGKLAPLSKLASAPNRDLSPILGDKEAIWFWDSKGSYHRFIFKDQTWTRHPVTGGMDVPVDASGNLWLPEGVALRSFHLPSIRRSVHWKSFNIEPGKAVWLYTNDVQAGIRLMRYDLKDGSLKTIIPLQEDDYIEYRIAQPYYSSQCMDEEGTVWLAGFQGLTKVRHTGNLFQHYLSKPFARIESPTAGTSARHLAEDAAGNIYMQDAWGGFYKIDPVTDATEKITLPPLRPINDEKYRRVYNWALLERGVEVLNQVHSVISGRDGSIWFSTALGMFRYDPQNSGAGFSTKNFRHYYFPTPLTVTIFPNGNDSIWWLTNQESYSVDKRTGASRRLTGLHRKHLEYGVMLPEEQTLWGFTDTGLVKINTHNLNTQFIRLYREPREQRCLVSHRGWLWIGSSKGLEKVHPKTFAHTNFDRSKGLPGNFVFCMVADGDYLWLGTSDGLCRFNVETGAVKNFYVEDGLSHNEFNTPSALKASNGRIYMGGLNGINAFFPADLEQKATIKSRILLSRFSLFDAAKDSLVFLSPNSIAGGIKLHASVPSFNLHLALTSFIDPGKNQYAWRMDGLDEDWYYAGNQHVAAYRHIPPGTYTFRAKAADSFGNWSENELTLLITVLRPWYSRWWAWLLYLLIAGSAVYALYRNQLSKKMEHAENKRLHELDTFKSRFFTNITHEFRTPLTVILGMADKLESDGANLSQPVTHAVSLIKRNGQNLLRLINQILDLAKLESNTLKINYVQGDVLPYLRYITESLQSFANAQNVMLRVESSEAQLMMDYDPERLLQIVYNLLSNAIKFTPSGGRVLLSAGSTQSANSTALLLTVSDTGVGIPPEDLPNIFDRFYQAKNLEKAKAGGTGIGLSLTKELVKAMGGEISVESRTSPVGDSGSVFTVWLPMTQSPLTPKVEAFPITSAVIPTTNLTSELPEISTPLGVTAQPAGLGSLNNEGNPSILLLEDNPDVVEYLVVCLGEHYRLDYAYNGRSGIEKALEIIPDLIISDVMMPEKDGFEVCETLKNDERTSHIPIILLTARADAASRIAGLRRGADAYLSKPFLKEELLVRISVLLDNQRRVASYFSQNLQLGKTVPFADAALSEAVQVEDAFVKKVNEIIEANYSDEDFALPQLCQKIGMSRSQLFRKMKAVMDTAPSDLIRTYRLNKAKILLENEGLNVAEAAYSVGFKDPSYFSKLFQEQFGIQPSATNK